MWLFVNFTIVWLLSDAGNIRFKDFHIRRKKNLLHVYKGEKGERLEERREEEKKGREREEKRRRGGEEGKRVVLGHERKALGIQSYHLIPISLVSVD